MSEALGRGRNDLAQWAWGGPGAEGRRAQAPHPVQPPAPLSAIAPLSSSVAPNKLLSAASGGKLGGRELAEGSFIHSFIHLFIQDAHQAPSCWCQGDAGMKSSPVEFSTVSRNVCVAVIAGDAQLARGGWCHQGLMPAGWAEPSSSRGSSSAGPEEGAGVAQQQGRAFRRGEQHALRKLGAPDARIPAARELEGQPRPQRPVTRAPSHHSRFNSEAASRAESPRRLAPCPCLPGIPNVLTCLRECTQSETARVQPQLGPSRAV